MNIIVYPRIGVYLMIRWVVGSADADAGSKRRIVARFPAAPSEPHKSVFDKLPQPITVHQDNTVGSVPITVKDRDNVTRFQGRPVGAEATASWYMLKEVKVGDDEMEYHVFPVEQNWVNFEKVSREPNAALDLEQTEKLMKERMLKSRSEYNDYLKLKSKKAQETGISSVKNDYNEESGAGISKSRKSLKFKRSRNDMPESAVSFKKADDEDGDGQWEGDEAFSDDDDQLFKDEVNEREELDIDDEDIIGEGDQEPVDSEDEEQLFKDTFGEEITKIMHDTHAKEKNIDEDDLDDELKKYGDLGSPDDEDMPEASQSSSSAPPAPSAPAQQAPLIIARKTSKEDQIRARIKGMFWRSEYKLKLKDILAQFPGLNRSSEEYQLLTKSLKDLAEVKDGVLHLKPQFRK